MTRYEKVYDSRRKGVVTVEVIDYEGGDFAVLPTTYQPLISASKRIRERHDVLRSIKYANHEQPER